jgi:Tfp pilus assembly protein PilN
MKEVDFRPDWYREGRKRKRNVVIRVTLLGVLALELFLASLGTFAQSATAQEEMAELQRSLDSQVEALRDLGELEAQLHNLRKKQELLSDVAGGAPVHCVLAELSRVMPGSVVLTEVHFAQQRRIADANMIADDEAPSPELTEWDELGTLEITGRAPSDVKVGVLLTGMAGSDLFRDLTLSYSQPVVVRGQVAREFKLTGTVPQFE